MERKYTKDALIDHHITTAHRRAVVFYKLCRHKVANGNLPWTYNDYLTAISAFYHSTIVQLEQERNRRHERKKDEKWRFIKTEDSGVRWEKRYFSRFEFDKSIREIIKNVSEKLKKDNP